VTPCPCQPGGRDLYVRRSPSSEAAVAMAMAMALGVYNHEWRHRRQSCGSGETRELSWVETIDFSGN
jgi:hypothetical protein